MFEMASPWTSLILVLTLCVQQSYHLIGPALRAVDPITADVKARFASDQPLDFAVYDDDVVEFDTSMLIDGANDQTIYRLEGGSYVAQHAVGRPVETCFTRHAHLSVLNRMHVCVRSALSDVVAFIRTVVSRIMPTRTSLSGSGTWTFRGTFHGSLLAAAIVIALKIYFDSQFARFVKLRMTARRHSSASSDAAQTLATYNKWCMKRVMQCVAVGRGAYIVNWAITILLLACAGSVSFKPYPTVHADENLLERGIRYVSNAFNIAGYVLGWEGIREWTIRAGGFFFLTLVYKIARCIESGFGCGMCCRERENKPSVRATPIAMPERGAFDDEKSAEPPACEDAKDAESTQLVPSAPPDAPVYKSAAAPPSLSRPVSIVQYADEDESEPIRQRKPHPRDVLMSVQSKMLLRSKSNEMFMSRVAQSSIQAQRLRQEQAADDKLRAQRLIGSVTKRR